MSKANSYHGECQVLHCIVRRHTLELRDVVALLSSDSRSARVTGVAMSVNTSTALSAAFWKDSEMVVGWIPGRKGGWGYVNCTIFGAGVWCGRGHHNKVIAKPKIGKKIAACSSS